MPDRKRTADSPQEREAPPPPFVVDFENQPHDTSYRIATGDTESLHGMIWMVVEAAKLLVNRLVNVRLLPGTIITVGGRRRELDGLVAADAPDGTIVVGVLEHKHDYDSRAQMQLCTNAAVAADELTKLGGRFHGKTVLVLAGLVVHGPAAAKVPPTVEEILKIATGTEGGFFSMGPVHPLNVGEIPEERVCARPKRWSLLAAMGMENRENPSDRLLRVCFVTAFQCKDEGLLLKGAAIVANIFRGLKDDARCNHLMLEALGETSRRKMMAMTAEQLFPTWAAEFRTELLAEGREKGREEGRKEGKIEMLLGIAEERFGEVPDELKERLRSASSEELDGWKIRLLRAPSIDAAMSGNGSWANGTQV